MTTRPLIYVGWNRQNPAATEALATIYHFGRGVCQTRLTRSGAVELLFHRVSDYWAALVWLLRYAADRGLPQGKII